MWLYDIDIEMETERERMREMYGWRREEGGRKESSD